MRKLSFMLFCTCVLFFHACKNYEDFREIDSVNYEPTFAVPLVNSSLSLDDVWESVEDDISYLYIAPDGSMSINYSQDQIQIGVAEIIQDIADFPIVLIDSAMSVPVLMPDNVVVTKTHLKNGTISFDIQSMHTEDIDLTIFFPDLTQNGVPFEMSTPILYQGSSPSFASIAPTSLENFDLSIPDGNLEIRYEAYNTSGNRVLLDLISGEAKDFEYSHIEGIWSNESFTLAIDTINIDIAENWVDGQISFEDPKLTINLSNSIGVPISIKTQNMIAYTADGNAIPVTSVFDDGYMVNYPALTEIGQEKTDQIILDKNNSNIVSVFNALPEYITYEVIAILNPENSSGIGFVSDNSTVKGNIEVEIPIYGTASGFTLETNTDFDMEDFEDMAYGTFKLITINEIPLDLNMQLYFMDESDNIIDSLFEYQQIILASPGIGINNMLLNPSEETNIIDISSERLDMIRLTNSIKTKAAFSTANGGTVPVRILSTQKVAVKLGAIISVQ
ncbi:MAG: hypothetical protein ACI8P3_001771 [Saprospiraceae bacterium]|jgi:hypothetical protein